MIAVIAMSFSSVVIANVLQLEKYNLYSFGRYLQAKNTYSKKMENGKLSRNESK